MRVALLDLECLQYKLLALHCDVNTYFLGNIIFIDVFTSFTDSFRYKETFKGARFVNRLLSSFLL